MYFLWKRWVFQIDFAEIDIEGSHLGAVTTIAMDDACPVDVRWGIWLGFATKSAYSSSPHLEFHR